MKQISLFIYLFISGLMLLAQAPEKINYQAVARDLSGNPLINQTLSVTFEIRQGSSSGMAVYIEAHTGVITNQFGLFTAEIGGGTASLGTFPGIQWGNGLHYLAVIINGNLMGSSQLLSVPYALYAKESQNGLQGLPGRNSLSIVTAEPIGSNCLNGGNKIEIGTDDNGNNTLEPLEIDFTYYVCNGDSGATGIGINWIGNNITFPPTPNATNDAFYHTIHNTSYIYNGTTWDTLVSGNVGSAGFWSQSGNTIYNNNIFGTGNVSIGTPLSFGKLTVASPAADSLIASFIGSNPTVSAITISNTNPTGAAGVTFLSGTNITSYVAYSPSIKTLSLVNDVTDGHIYINSDSTIVNQTKIIANQTDIIANQAQNAIYNNTDTIYNYSPAGAVVHVNQGLFMTDSLYVLGNNFLNPNWILVNNGLGQAKWTNPSSLGLGGSLWQSNTPNIYFNTGNVGIGTINPSAKLHVGGGTRFGVADTASIFFQSGGGGNGAARDWKIYVPMPNGNLSFRDMGFDNLNNGMLGDAMVIQRGTGNVGIGTANPSFKLHVSSNDTIISAFTGTNTFGSVIMVSNSLPNIAGMLMKSGVDSAFVGYNSSDKTLEFGTMDKINGNIRISTGKKIELRADTIFAASEFGSVVYNTNKGTFFTDSLYVYGVGFNTIGNVLTTNGNGKAQWQPLPGAANAWNLTGNAGTNATTNFIGTTDNVALNFRVDNQTAGKVDGVSGNTFFGFLAGTSTTGNFNTANGWYALFSNTLGYKNTAYGMQSLYGNTIGNWNTAIGEGALFTNDAGSEGVAIGYQSQRNANNITTAWTNTNTSVGMLALRGSTTPSSNTGIDNTAIGNRSMLNNTSGGGNTANGYQSLYNNTSGSNNIAIGYQSLWSNTTGNNNTATGHYALHDNTTGVSNTASGYYSLNKNVNGNRNSAFGEQSMYWNNGIANASFGYATLQNNYTGNYNAVLGSYAGYNSTGSGNVYIGYQAGYSATGDNKLYIANNNINPPLIYGDFAAGNVGIGTTTPNAKLDVEGTFKLGIQGNVNQKYITGAMNTNTIVIAASLAVYVVSIPVSGAAVGDNVVATINNGSDGVIISTASITTPGFVDIRLLNLTNTSLTSAFTISYIVFR